MYLGRSKIPPMTSYVNAPLNQNWPLHSVPIGMKSQTWKFFRSLREIQIHQQTKGLILVFYYQFNQVLVIKSEEIPHISQKFFGV